MVEAHASGPNRGGTPEVSHRCAFAAVFVAALVLGGCGSSSSSSSSHSHARAAVQLNPPCAAAARAALASGLRVPLASVTAVPGTSNGGSPQCVFRTPGAKVTAVIYSGAQPFFLLERTIVEYQQSFTSVRLTTAPVHVGKLGLDAAWFPGQRWVMTTDGVRLITITINWHGVSQAQRRALGIALARTYLGPFHHNAAAGY